MVTAHKRKRTKTLRSRCAECGKQFRHADPLARACSSACRQRLYRQRLKARKQAEQERREAERQERWAAIKRAAIERAARLREQAAQAEPTEPRRPSNPAPAPRRHRVAPPPAPDQVVTIVMPKRAPMTPI